MSIESLGSQGKGQRFRPISTVKLAELIILGFSNGPQTEDGYRKETGFEGWYCVFARGTR